MAYVPKHSRAGIVQPTTPEEAEGGAQGRHFAGAGSTSTTAPTPHPFGEAPASTARPQRGFGGEQESPLVEEIRARREQREAKEGPRILRHAEAMEQGRY